MDEANHPFYMQPSEEAVTGGLDLAENVAGACLIGGLPGFSRDSCSYHRKKSIQITGQKWSALQILINKKCDEGRRSYMLHAS